MKDDELDPEQDARIRALLAEVRTTDDTTLPPEVAARLDETLAGLVAESEDAADETADGTNVIPLRRRWAPRAAAAAAAVIVVGAGGVAVANLGVFGGSNATSDSAKSSAGGGQAESFARSASDSPAPSKPRALSAAALPRITSASFDADVARLVHQDLASAPQDNTRNLRKAERNGVSGDVPGCTGPKAGDGSQRETVLYDGTRAVLVVHPPQQGEQAVVAWNCQGDHVLARTSVPVADESPSTPGDPGLGSPSPSP